MLDSAAVASSSAAAVGRCVVRLRLPRAWTAEEDATLHRLAKENGFARWHRVARRMGMGMGRSARQCRDRWRHHLARDVYHRPFTADDDEELRRLVERFGSGGRWKDIGGAVYGRTSRVMKRRWREIRNKKQHSARKLHLQIDDEDDQDMETITESAGETTASYADEVLASSMVSCSLACDAAVDPWAGSLALGFACMAV